MLPPDPNAIVGYDSSDDAAAYRLENGTVILQSVDFFTPIVDDPYDFGQIAAANALSDIYAMGGSPLFALNIVGFPKDDLPLDTLTKIMTGGADKAHEAGIHVLGGHTIDDKEPKYGMVVTGQVDENRLMRNSAAEDGDLLILTKPLGTGITATAIKQGLASQAQIDQAVANMIHLNKSAATAAINSDVKAMTDVTGFGLLGHLMELCKASGLKATINFNDLPFLDGVTQFASQGIVPSGSKRNLAHVDPHLAVAGGLDELAPLLASDAQTSGGLLIAVKPNNLDKLLTQLREANTPAATLVGQLTASGPATLSLK